MKRGNILIFNSDESFYSNAAILIGAKIREVIASGKNCRLCLAGGTTPGPLYKLLVDSQNIPPLPLEKIEIFFGDERIVSKNHKESNFNMVMSFFADKKDKFAKIHRMETFRDDIEQVENDYDKLLDTPMDILILGLGEDAHIASIFPNSKCFNNSTKNIMVIKGPKPPPVRMTITPRVISKAHKIFILAKGSGKANAIKNVFYKPYNPKDYPGQVALNGTWITDIFGAQKLIEGE